MPDLLFELLRVSTGFAIVLGLFLILQSYVRRHSGCRSGQDPLDYMPHGCSNCSRGLSGQCAKRPRPSSGANHESA